MNTFDELRFGPQGILNLREDLPVAEEAVRRAENWLREHQVRGTKEVLVITGRGNQSIAGVAVIKGAIEKLLFSLRRRGVVASHAEHNPGAFAVQLAPIRSLVEVMPRRREPARPPESSIAVHGLSAETMALLRDLAERSLDALGVSTTDDRVADEIHRYLSAIVPALPGDERMEARLQEAIRDAIAGFD